MQPKGLPDELLNPFEEKKSQEEIDRVVKQMMDAHQDKKYKVDYLHAQRDFINELCDLSAALKAVPLAKRRDHLTIELKRINDWLRTNVQNVVDPLAK